MPNTQYFLGGNTPSGFYSLYHQLSDPEIGRASCRERVFITV